MWNHGMLPIFFLAELLVMEESLSLMNDSARVVGLRSGVFHGVVYVDYTICIVSRELRFAGCQSHFSSVGILHGLFACVGQLTVVFVASGGLRGL